MKVTRSFVMLAIVMVLAASMAFAGGQGEGEVPAGTDAEGEQLSVAALVHWQGPYTQQLIMGAQAAAEEYGASFQSAGPAGIDPPEHISIFRDILATNPDAITNVAYPEELWVSLIDETVNNGIPVATYDVASPTSLQSVHAGPRQKDLGVALANEIADEIGPNASGTIIIGNGIPGLDVLEVRVTGFKEVMADRVPGVTVDGPYNVTFEQAENFSIWQQLVQNNQDAIAFVGVTEMDLTNLVRIRERDDNPGYLIASVGINPDALEGVKTGEAFAAVGQKPFLQGYVAMRALLESLQSGQEPPRGWIDVGVELATMENVDEIQAREESLSQGYEQTLQYYQPEVERIFDDLDAAVQSFGDYVAP